MTQPAPRDPRSGDWMRWETYGLAESRPRVPWLGIFLVLLGVVLLLGQLTTPFDAGTLLLAALGGALAIDWLVNRAHGALVPACFFGALAVDGALHDVGLISGDGWGPLILGLGLVLAWFLGQLESVSHRGSLLLGAILAIIGGIEVAGRVTGVSLGDLWPVILIALGVAIILGQRDRLRI